MFITGGGRSVAGAVNTNSFKSRITSTVARLLRQALCVPAIISILSVFSAASAGTFTVYGPQVFQRTSGSPVVETYNFSILDPSAEYTLHVYNGGIEDDEVTGDQVSSSFIIINGTDIVGEQNFNQNVTTLSEAVTLAPLNELTVEVRGKPGGVIAVDIIGIDNTPPVITASIDPAPGTNGWHTSTVTVSFSCSDATSGIQECPDPIVVNTEGAGQVISGTATDNAGNSATASVTLSIDTTPPSITATVDPAPGANGWHTSTATVSFTCSDADSGIQACPEPVVVNTDGAGQVITGTATDNAGNTGSASVTLNFDATAPVITATVDPAPDANGWHTSTATVSFTCSDATSGVQACPEPVVVNAEGAGQVISGTVTDAAGNTGSASVTLNIDATAPTITATVDPAPGTSGWLTSAATVSFTCTDEASGIQACPDPVTVNTEGAGQVITGTATDAAGNTGTASVTLNIDNTAPVITATIEPLADTNGWHTATVTISFTCSDTTSDIQTCPDPIVVDTEGAEQVISATATDIAGNTAAASVTLNVDTTSPSLIFQSPVANSALQTTTPDIEVTYGDNIAVDANSLQFTVNGAALAVSCQAVASGAVCTPGASLPEGAVTLVGSIQDIAGNSQIAQISFEIVTDNDGDGVLDNSDQCAGTPAGETVDTNGCSPSQLDEDTDGVSDALDQCPGTAAGDSVDVIGCSPLQIDTDNDGHPDVNDAFPNDPTEWSDADGDGIGGNADTDRDGDGVENPIDIFPDDPTESSDLDDDGIGDNSDSDRDGDGVNNDEDYFPDDPNASTVPQVIFTSPQNLSTVGVSPVQVTGTLDDSAAVLTVNGIQVTHSGGAFQASVALEEGHNAIVARAVDALGHEGTDSLNISLDMTPPYITIESPADGSTLSSDVVAVTGLVNDIVRGTITDQDAVVTVNGVQASVANRTYLAEGIALVEGANAITVSASDAVGNTASITATVTYEPPVGAHIELVNGQGQSGQILNQLPNLLEVKLLDSAGEPVEGKNVVFRVIQGDGAVASGLPEESRGALAVTNSLGVASTGLRLGSRAGEGLHRVRAKAVGFDGEVVFHANATPQPGDKLGVIAGNNQRGIVRQSLPEPLVVAVTDTGANLIANTQVEFKVTRGGGKFDNGSDIYLATTDSDGRASASWMLGPDEGLDVQRVTATLVGTNASAGFTASGFMPGDPGETVISGVVLDNLDQPVPGVTVRVDGTTRQAVSDAEGQFTIVQAPVGPVHLIADGSTATVPGEWPNLSYNIVTVAGVDNPLHAPIYMVKLDTANAITVGAQDVEYTLPEIPGFKLKVKAGSVTFPDGSNSGQLSVTVVNANKVPMPPPNAMQPQFIVTIQPAGAMFDPPAPLSLPNVDGHLPGAQIEMYSYDHDLEEFVTIGLGTVSKDGSVIESNPGVGVVKAGWHCGSQPSAAGCCGSGGGGCPVCQKSESNDCNNGDCADDDTQDPGECKKCSGGSPVNDDSEDPGECKSCIDGKAEEDPDGATCDDGKFCTSYDGFTPGPDQCEGGECLGTKIDRQKTSEQIVQIDFGKVRDFLQDDLSKILNLLDPGGKEFKVTIKATGKKLSVKECCELDDKIVDNTGEEGNLFLEGTGTIKTKLIVVLTPIGPVTFQFGGKVSGRGKIFRQTFEEACLPEENKCYVKEGGQVSGFGELFGTLGYLHPNLLSGTGAGRYSGSYSATDECGVFDHHGCSGPLSLRGTVTALSFASHTWVYIVPGTQGCSESDT